jgi:hypothetical protein
MNSPRRIAIELRVLVQLLHAPGPNWAVEKAGQWLRDHGLDLAHHTERQQQAQSSRITPNRRGINSED